MTPTAGSTRTQARMRLLKEHVRTVDNERGFALVFAICMLSVCMLIGIASMNTSVDEVDITRNEVMVRRTLTYAMSAVPLAALAIANKKGDGVFPKDKYVLEDSNHYITILDSHFLDEGMDLDNKTFTGWNNKDKWHYAGTEFKKANFEPIDDINGKGDDDDPTDCTDPDNVGICADIRIQKVTDDGEPVAGSLFTMLVDVDTVKAKPDKGGNTVQGENPDLHMVFVMDCKATLPGRDLDNKETPPPVNELIVGYYYRPLF